MSRSISKGDPDAKTLILDAINHKQSNGAAYCGGKTLVVFLDTPMAGVWFPNEVAKGIAGPAFVRRGMGNRSFFMIRTAGSYVYNLTLLDVTDENAPAFLLRIQPDFDAWNVEQIQ